MVKVGISEPKRVKIGPKTIDVIFIGYSLDSNTYKFLVINYEISSISDNIIIESKDVIVF